MSSLIWTSEPPREPGFYWLNVNGKLSVVHVRVGNGKRTALYTFPSTDPNATPTYPIEYIKGQWAGPIIPPEETGG